MQDYGPWDQRARAYAFSRIPTSASYVAGPNGDSALRLTASAEDELVLSHQRHPAFQFDVNDSFTLELTMKTTDADGVIIGTRPGIKGYALQIVGGKLQFSITDLTNSATITSTANVNDGAGTDRGRRARRHDQDHGDLSSTACPPPPRSRHHHVPRTATEPRTPMVMGSSQPVGSKPTGVHGRYFADHQRGPDPQRVSGQTIGRHAAIAIHDPCCPTNSPTSIPGLQLWLPAYDPTRLLRRLGVPAPGPCRWTRFDGMATRSMMDLEHPPQGFRTQSTNSAPVYHVRRRRSGSDTTGNYKADANQHAPARNCGAEQSNGVYAKNFDFVQNTGVFTLSAFVKVSAETGAWMTIFSTNAALPRCPASLCCGNRTAGFS